MNFIINVILCLFLLMWISFFVYNYYNKYKLNFEFCYKPDERYDYIDINLENRLSVEKIIIRSNNISDYDGWIHPGNRKFYRDFYFDSLGYLRQVNYYEFIDKKPFEKIIFEYNQDGNLLLEKRLLENGKIEICKYSYRWFFNCLNVRKSNSDDIEKFYFKNKKLYKKKFVQNYKIFDNYRSKTETFYLKNGKLVNNDDFYEFSSELEITNESKSIYEYNENNDWILKRQSINENLEQEIKRKISYI